MFVIICLIEAVFYLLLIFYVCISERKKRMIYNFAGGQNMKVSKFMHYFFSHKLNRSKKKNYQKKSVPH